MSSKRPCPEISAPITDQDSGGKHGLSILQVPMICIGWSSGETCSRDVVGNPYSGTLTYATFHARVRDVLRNHHFRIVQDGNCTLSNFLKLKGPVLNNAGVVQSDWPLWSRQIADDIERLGEFRLPEVAVQQALNNQRNVVLAGVSPKWLNACTISTASALSLYINISLNGEIPSYSSL
jgi:hypothetical protein